MGSFEDFASAVIRGSEGLAQETLNGFIVQARGDTSDFLNQSTQRLQEWSTQLGQGQMTKDEFADLVGGLKDLATMRALTQAGIAAANVQRFRNAVIKLVIDTAFKTFLP